MLHLRPCCSQPWQAPKRPPPIEREHCAVHCTAPALAPRGRSHCRAGAHGTSPPRGAGSGAGARLPGHLGGGRVPSPQQGAPGVPNRLWRPAHGLLSGCERPGLPPARHIAQEAHEGVGKGSSAWGGGEGRALPAAPAPVTGRHASTPGAPTPSHELPQVAPRTVEHMRKLGEMGLFNTNHFFRVDRGFVAQTADVLGGRSAPMNPEQKVRGRGAVRQGAQSCCAQRGSSRGLEWLVGAALLGADAQHAIACPRPASRPPTQPAASRRPRRRSTCLWRW